MRVKRDACGFRVVFSRLTDSSTRRSFLNAPFRGLASADQESTACSVNQPTPDPSQEGSKRSSAPSQFPSWEGPGLWITSANEFTQQPSAKYQFPIRNRDSLSLRERDRVRGNHAVEHLKCRMSQRHAATWFPAHTKIPFTTSPSSAGPINRWFNPWNG